MDLEAKYPPPHHTHCLSTLTLSDIEEIITLLIYTRPLSGQDEFFHTIPTVQQYIRHPQIANKTNIEKLMKNLIRLRLPCHNVH